MIQILDKDYSGMKPIQPKYNALCVFNRESASIAFNHTLCDFVFAMNEDKNTFKQCYSLKECVDFWDMNN